MGVSAMSIVKDIDEIISLLPSRREPTSRELIDARKKFHRRPARQLRHIRRALESLKTINKTIPPNLLVQIDQVNRIVKGS